MDRLGRGLISWRAGEPEQVARGYVVFGHATWRLSQGDAVYEHWHGPFAEVVEALDAYGPVWQQKTPISATAEVRAAALAHFEATFATDLEERRRTLDHVRDGLERCEEILV